MNLFFSYSRVQKDEIADIVHASTVYHTCWYDKKIGAGDEWWTEILSQIRNCDIFVFVLSKESTESKACEAELTYADNLGKHIIALQVDDQDVIFMPHLLKDNNITSYKPTDTGRETALAIILKNINDNLDEYKKNWKNPSTVPEPPIPKSELDIVYTAMTLKESLTYEEQRDLLFKFEKLVDKEEEKPETIATALKDFKKRDETTAFIAKKIDELLKIINGRINPDPINPPKPIINKVKVLQDIINTVGNFTEDKNIGNRLQNAVHNASRLFGNWRLVRTMQNNQSMPLMVEEEIVFNNDYSFYLIQNYMQTNFGRFTFQGESLTITFFNGVIDTSSFQCLDNELYIVHYMNNMPFSIFCYQRSG
jgi:hypothetical protein